MTSPAPLGRANAVADLGGRSAALHYGDPALEVAALHEQAAVVDRGHRLRLRVRGARASEMVTGLVTNDVLALTPGNGLYAAALTPKGKIIADVRIYSHADSLVIDAPLRSVDGLMAVVRKFLNPRVAPYEDESSTTAMIGVRGPHAVDLVVAALRGDVTRERLLGLPALGHVDVADGGWIARSADLWVGGFDLFVGAGSADEIWNALRDAGAIEAGLEAWDTVRVESGCAEWGIDIDDSTIPQEANLDDLHAISYTKGCYTGQETVARVHFRGHVNRHLRGLRFARGAALPGASATLFDGTGKPVGDVRSTVLSPRLGLVALGMVRREVTAGEPVVVRWDGGEAAAVVETLPFLSADTARVGL